MMRDDRNRLAVLRTARTAHRLALVAEQFDVGQERQVEVRDLRDAFAHAQRQGEMERLVEAWPSRVARERERLHG